jgi:hypothetical protein
MQRRWLQKLRPQIDELRILRREHGGGRERVWREWRATLLTNPGTEPPELTP